MQLSFFASIEMPPGLFGTESVCYDGVIIPPPHWCEVKELAIDVVAIKLVPIGSIDFLVQSREYPMND
jgi:hypothetical protein